MEDQELVLDKNRKRVKYCPCGKSNKDGKFSPFKGFEKEGYCHSCNESFFPDSGTLTDTNKYTPVAKYIPPKKPSFYSYDLVKKSNHSYSKNNFVLFLKTTFGKEKTEKAILDYLICTSKHWKGSTIFWQIDNNENIRHGKIMLYNKMTGKRVKDNSKTHITSVNSALGVKDFVLVQCLFGLHLINISNSNVCAVVESEKTAIIMSIVMPQYIWLATGGKGNFKYAMLEPVRDYNIVAYPDASEYYIWQQEAAALNKKGFKIKVSDVLENDTYDIGTDLADLYLDQNYISESIGKEEQKTSFENSVSKEIKCYKTDALDKMIAKNDSLKLLIDVFDLDKDNITILKTKTEEDNISSLEVEIIEPPEQLKIPQQDIENLKQFFKSVKTLPSEIKLDQCTTLTNPVKMIQSHLDVLLGNSGYRIKTPYLDRLNTLKSILES